MFKTLRIIAISLILIGFITGVNSQPKTQKVASPLVAPKKVILLDEFIKVNSQDTISVQTIHFPLMTEAEKIFINKTISDYRSPKIKQFIDSFYNRDKISNGYTSNFSYSQNWTFEIIYQSQTEISFKLLKYEYTGGAHGNTSVKNFNIDLKNMREYKFTDKFKPLNVEKVLEYCTNYCLTNNIPIFDNEIEQTPELFNIWNFTNEGLLLTFPQYSIAPYSSGIIEIHIPNKDLKMLFMN